MDINYLKTLDRAHNHPKMNIRICSSYLPAEKIEHLTAWKQSGTTAAFYEARVGLPHNTMSTFRRQYISNYIGKTPYLTAQLIKSED